MPTSHLRDHWPKYLASLLPLTYLGRALNDTDPNWRGVALQLPALVLGTLLFYLAARAAKKAYDAEARRAERLRSAPGRLLLVWIGAAAGGALFFAHTGVSFGEVFPPGWWRALFEIHASITGGEPPLMSLASYSAAGAAIGYLVGLAVEKLNR